MRQHCFAFCYRLNAAVATSTSILSTYSLNFALSVSTSEASPANPMYVFSVTGNTLSKLQATVRA